MKGPTRQWPVSFCGVQNESVAYAQLEWEALVPSFSQNTGPESLHVDGRLALFCTLKFVYLFQPTYSMEQYKGKGCRGEICVVVLPVTGDLG